VVNISASFPPCDRCGLPTSDGFARITNEKGTVSLCWDPDKVSCYDLYILDQKHGPF
jgi:hypothetical protein